MTTKSLYDFCIENEDKKYLLEEWDYEKNSKNGLYIEDIGFGSEKNVWWHGKCGHKWNATPYARKKGTNCPFCSNHKVLAGYNDLATTHQELTKEWDYSKNSGLNPTDVIAGSKTAVWWTCEKKHSWKAIVSSRAEAKTGCPYCTNHKVLTGYNDLATKHSELIKEWHPVKNGDLKPTDVLAGSHKKIWWICQHGHEWESAVVDRVQGKGCPYCSNQKVLAGFNDLATTHPELAKEWSPKNKEKPTEVISGSRKKFLWKCENGHEWESDIPNRKAGYNCPYCHNQTSIPEIMLFLAFKSLFKDVYHRYKLEKTEFDVYVKDINLLIEYDGDYWHQNRKEKDKRKNEIAQKHNLTFVRIWEYRDTKEKAKLNNKDILYFNKNKGYEILLQEFINHINNFYNLNVEYISSGNEEQFAKEYLKKEKYENSLAIIRPDIATEWHPTKNGSLTPTMVTARSGEKVWWKCEHGHEWQASISNRTNKENGTSCPVCSNRKILKGFNDLETTNPELVKQWHPTKNGDLKPSDVVSGSKKKVWWICNEGHEWEASILNRAKKNSGCPHCYKRK